MKIGIAYYAYIMYNYETLDCDESLERNLPEDIFKKGLFLSEENNYNG